MFILGSGTDSSRALSIAAMSPSFVIRASRSLISTVAFGLRSATDAVSFNVMFKVLKKFGLVAWSFSNPSKSTSFPYSSYFEFCLVGFNVPFNISCCFLIKFLFTINLLLLKCLVFKKPNNYQLVSMLPTFRVIRSGIYEECHTSLNYLFERAVSTTILVHKFLSLSI